MVFLSSQTLSSLRKPNHSLPEAGKPEPSPHVHEESPERKHRGSLLASNSPSAGCSRRCAWPCLLCGHPAAVACGQSPALRHHLLFLVAADLWVAVLAPNWQEFEAFVVWMFPKPVCKPVYSRRVAFKLVSISINPIEFIKVWGKDFLFPFLAVDNLVLLIFLPRKLPTWPIRMHFYPQNSQ